MKRFTPLISLLIVVLITGVCLAKSDLVVTNITLSPVSPFAGEEVTITAEVKNVGTTDVSGRFYVRFSVDGMQIDNASIPFGIDVGSSKLATVSWTAQVGTHTIMVEADQPFNKVSESSEANNISYKTFTVSISSVTSLSDLKIAVARFDDRSGSGFINVGQGVADELITRLVNSGMHVLERSELESVMQEQSLNPALTGDLAKAGQILGADLLVIGSVTRVDVQETSLSLGFFSVSSASVNVAMSARLVNVYTSEIEKAVSSTGEEEGATGFSVNIGKIVSLSQPVSSNVCTGGLLTDKPYYYFGEIVRIGYQGTPGWYRVEISTAGGTFVRLLDWKFISAGACGEWFWNQRNMSNMQMGPGMYVAKLWHGGSYVVATSFEIRTGAAPVPLPIDEITVGSGQFDETIVGKATDTALNQLVASLIQGAEQVASKVIGARGSVEPTTNGEVSAGKAQIAAVFPDGRIVINVGAATGVNKGDFFQVLHAQNVIIDPSTGEILDYEILGIKGEIVIVEVRERVSYAIKITEFVPLVGDMVEGSVP